MILICFCSLLYIYIYFFLLAAAALVVVVVACDKFLQMTSKTCVFEYFKGWRALWQRPLC